MVGFCINTITVTADIAKKTANVITTTVICDGIITSITFFSFGIDLHKYMSFQGYVFKERNDLKM